MQSQILIEERITKLEADPNAEQHWQKVWNL